MKKILLSSLLILAAHFSFGKDLNAADVPAIVKACVDSVYPKTPVIRWELESGRYEAWVKKKDNEVAVCVLPTGQVFSFIKSRKASDLPKAAQEFIKKTAKLEDVKEAEEILYTRINKTMYLVEYKGSLTTFDDKGNFIRKEAGSGSGSGDEDVKKPEPVKAAPKKTPAQGKQ